MSVSTHETCLSSFLLKHYAAPIRCSLAREHAGKHHAVIPGAELLWEDSPAIPEWFKMACNETRPDVADSILWKKICERMEPKK